MNLEPYWQMYDATLARVRDEKPDTFAALKAILDGFTPPSSGDAFFPGGADDDLADALIDAGWNLDFTEGDYLYTATHPATHAQMQHVEGDIYNQTPERVRLTHTTDVHTTLAPGATGTVEFTDDAGTVHVRWDDGSRLGLIPGEDTWIALCTRCCAPLVPGCCDTTEEAAR